MGRTQSRWLPSYWAANGVLASAEGMHGQTLFQFGLILSNALMSVLVACVVANWIFYSGYSSLTGYSARGGTLPGKRLLGRIDGMFNALRQPARALVVKDVKLFWRDPTQWSQFVIFFGIMAVYIASLRNRSAAFDSETYRNWIICLNIGACTLILATLTSRFVYPLISLEGRRFWVLGLAPVNYSQIMWQKFWLSVATTSVFTVTVTVLSCIMLDVGPLVFALSIYSIVITNFGLSGLAVGMGSLYPNFNEDNPARIVSGMGGTLNFLLSMGYIAVVIGALTFTLQMRVLERFDSDAAFWTALGVAVTLITSLSALSTFLPMRLGLRNLTASEY